MPGSAIVVFLGPSLSVAEAARILPALYRPPAEQGDVVRAVRDDDAGTIALVDGAFASAPAVRHKEILWAMARGVRVFGAASMGALRAAELHGYGMRGSGLIYRWYRATPLADDDEVAVVMTPREIGAAALSEALFSMRITLRHAERAGFVTRANRLRLVALARSIHFTQRSYELLFTIARDEFPDTGWIERLEIWAGSNAIDQKRVDAVGLLTSVAAVDPGPLPDVPAFRMTEAWADDLDVASLYSPDI